MIDNFKPIGAFLEYTVRPLISEFKWFLKELDKRKIKVTEKNITGVCRNILKYYIAYMFLSILQAFIVTSMVCYTAWLILKG